MDYPLNFIESKFYNAAIRYLPGLVPQYWIGPYRVDFAVPADKLAIEIDSQAYHDEHQRIYKDRPRQAAIEAQGWTVIRFEAYEVNDELNLCVRRAQKWLQLKRNGLHIERMFPTL